METFTPIQNKILKMLSIGATDVLPIEAVGPSLVVIVKRTAVHHRVVFGSYVFNNFVSLIRDVISITGNHDIRYLGDALDAISEILDVETHVVNKVTFQNSLDTNRPDFNYMRYFHISRAS